MESLNIPPTAPTEPQVPENVSLQATVIGTSPPPEPLVSPIDNFRQGTILKFFRQAGYGFIRDRGGKEVYFHLDELRLVGEKNDRKFIGEGTRVGFDIGRTSRGLRVTKIKVY